MSVMIFWRNRLEFVVEWLKGAGASSVCIAVGKVEAAYKVLWKSWWTNNLNLFRLLSSQIMERVNICLITSSWQPTISGAYNAFIIAHIHTCSASTKIVSMDNTAELMDKFCFVLWVVHKTNKKETLSFTKTIKHTQRPNDIVKPFTCWFYF